jgi:heptaprenyl diphosphate synthase
MQSPGKTRTYTTLAILVSSAMVLQIIETPLPRIIPWLKPGLANCLTLFALYRLSFKMSLGVAFLRTLLSSFILGSFLTPLFYMSFGGAVLAAVVMGIIKHSFKEVTIEIVSISGALTNNLAQLLVLQILFAENLNIWFYIALTIWIAIPAGYIVAKITAETLRRTHRSAQ